MSSAVSAEAVPVVAPEVSTRLTAVDSKIKQHGAKLWADESSSDEEDFARREPPKISGQKAVARKQQTNEKQKDLRRVDNAAVNTSSSSSRERNIAWARDIQPKGRSIAPAAAAHTSSGHSAAAAAASATAKEDAGSSWRKEKPVARTAGATGYSSNRQPQRPDAWSGKDAPTVSGAERHPPVPHSKPAVDPKPATSTASAGKIWVQPSGIIIQAPSDDETETETIARTPTSARRDNRHDDSRESAPRREPKPVKQANRTIKDAVRNHLAPPQHSKASTPKSETRPRKDNESALCIVAPDDDIDSKAMRRSDRRGPVENKNREKTEKEPVIESKSHTVVNPLGISSFNSAGKGANSPATPGRTVVAVALSDGFVISGPDDGEDCAVLGSSETIDARIKKISQNNHKEKKHSAENATATGFLVRTPSDPRAAREPHRGGGNINSVVLSSSKSSSGKHETNTSRKEGGGASNGVDSGGGKRTANKGGKTGPPRSVLASALNSVA